MNRRGTKEEIIDIITKIRKKIKNAVIRTTFIVGYPGESEEDFNELMDFIEEYPFDLLGAFTYSKEENTKAYEKEQINEEIKEKRLEILMKKQEEISLMLNKKRIGKTYDVRVNMYNPLKKVYRGYSYMSAPDNIDGYVYFTSDVSLPRNSIVKVKITDATSHDLYGEAL
jgi:ribosomal protein S12 methylthiotransferase